MEPNRHHVDVHLHVESDPRLDEVLVLLKRVLAKEKQLMSDVSNLSGEIDALTAQVAASTTVQESAVALISGFAAQLQAAIDAATAAGASPEQIAALVALGSTLDSESASLAAAVEANTTPAP